MRVLVTGAGGFIGRRVSERLERERHQVIRVGRRDRFRPHSPVLNLDLLEPSAIQRSIKDLPDVVAHLAAVIPTCFTGIDAERAAEANRLIDQNVFLACAELGVPVVYTSSSSVYGFGGEEILSEDSPTYPSGPYAEAKLASEQEGERLLTGRGLPFTALRINAPYGPGQRARTVLKIFIERGMKGLPLLYHGNGSRQQDFTYVDDVAAAVSNACAVGRSGLYNITAQHPVTMRRLAELVVECLPGCASRIAPSGQKDEQEGAGASYSIKRARCLLGWHPRVTLEEGIRAWAPEGTQ
ncbi:MAG: NAD-dependent epimerase/dehydratase family protein [Acidobacteriota bacterium]